MAKFQEIFAPFLTGNRVSEDNVAYCPAHENPLTSHSPSAQINFDRGIWYCFVCVPEKHEATLAGLAGLLQDRIDSGDIDLAQLGSGSPSTPAKNARATGSRRPVPTEAQVAAWQTTLSEFPKRRNYLIEKRLLTKATLEAWKIGFSTLLGRYTIPVYDNGKLIDARCRSGNREATEDKYIWWRGGATPLFGVHMLPPSPLDIVIFEGELDTILAWQDKIPAVSGTAGSGTWKPAWTKFFTGKNVFVCYDDDKAGSVGRARVVKALKEIALVYKVDCGDYTEWRAAGHTVDEFHDLMDIARLNPVAKTKEITDLPKAGEPITLAESQNADRNGKPVELTVAVIGKSEPAYTVPRRVEYNCDQGKGATCKGCPMSELYDGRHIKDYNANSDIVRFGINANAEQMHRALKNDIKAKCVDHLEIDRIQDWNIEELYVTDTIESRRTNNGGSDITRAIYNVGTFNTRVNVGVRIVGEQKPHKNDQRGQLFSWIIEEVESNIDSFRMTPEIHEKFKVFRTQPGETPLQRARKIAEDQAHYITHIYGRANLHIAYALVYHSPLNIRLLGTEIKGTLELGVPGDSRTGKSATIEKLRNHYNGGIVVACDQASLSGLIGGLQQVGNGKQWLTNWGIVPQYDRRLVALDEAQSLKDKDIIPNMSSVRSSGWAEITKIKTAKTNARVRLVWIFNSPSGGQLISYADGAMQAVRDLFPAHEDIARFDLMIPVGRDDVASEVINARNHGKKPPHIYTGELESEHVRWCWSRDVSQITWARGTEDHLLRKAREIGATYTPDFPLIQAENVREKLARVAAAMAMLVYSTDKTGEKVIIRNEHVDGALAFIDKLYGSQLMGYKNISQIMAKDEETAKGNRGAVKEFLNGATKRHDTDGRRIMLGLLTCGGRFEVRSFADSASMELPDVNAAMRWLEDQKMIRRIRGGKLIEPVPELMSILREIQHEDTPD